MSLIPVCLSFHYLLIVFYNNNVQIQANSLLQKTLFHKNIEPELELKFKLINVEL